jgi:hypothetical protein
MGELDDDDKARMVNTEVKLFGITVAKMLTIESLPPDVSPKSARAFLKDMDLELNVFGRLPDRTCIQRIKDLAWQYRRQMPAYLAPKLPPHDPIVQEMEAHDAR